MGATNLYWKSMQAGAQKAADELGVDMLWKAPLKEDDRAAQIAIVEQFASQGVSGIVLAPLDSSALRRPVAGAMDKKIPVVIVDSPLRGEAGRDFTALVATNNEAGGEVAGRELARLLGGKGKVVLLRNQEGAASTNAREAGFLKVMAQNAGIEMIVQNRYGGATTSEAQSNAMNLVDKLREADGIFTPNESTTFGMLLALRQSNLIRKVKFVGFDTSPSLLEALRKGEIQALVAQNPRKMAYEAVQLAVAAIKGQPFERNIDSGAKLLTAENLDSAEVKEILGTR